MPEIIKFLCDDTIYTIEGINPNTTILSYLRNQLNRCGTKEGCGSGDCGACTVVVGELIGDEVRYKSVNACITFLPSLHGKQLITVENVKQHNQLHPVQQAMIDFHGSQCGFCTPGFVMSLYALEKNYPIPSKTQIFEALSGNLCCCTGYRSIMNAATNIAQSNTYPPTPYNNTDVVEKLRTINNDPLPTLSNGVSHYYAPRNSQTLVELLQKYPKAHLLAGGTDLALTVTQQHKDLKTIIYLGNIAELKTIKESNNALYLGAAVTYYECIKLLKKQYPELGDMMERLGSLQVRNQGTIGGNIGNASPIGDMSPVLMALNANITLHQGNNSRRIAISDYFVDYKVTDLQAGEFIHTIEIPKAKAGYQLKVYKISKRIDDDISAVLGAFYLKIENNLIKNVSIAFGGMAAIPKRAKHCEATLDNKPWAEQTITKAAIALEQDFSPLSDVRASATYRMQVAKNLLRKCFLEINNPMALTRVTDYA